MTSLREAQREFTRQKLVDAAAQVFAAKGYGNATVEDVVSTAGASRATFYLYFKTKSDLVRELLKELDEEARTALEGLAELSPIGDNTRIVQSWVETLIDVYERHAVNIRCLYEAEALDPSLQPVVLEGMRLFSGALEKKFSSFHGRSVGAAAEEEHLTGVLLFLQFERLCDLWFTRGLELDRKTAVSTLTKLWSRALGCAGEAPGSK